MDDEGLERLERRRYEMEKLKEAAAFVLAHPKLRRKIVIQ